MIEMSNQASREAGLFDRAEQCLLEPDVANKVRLVEALRHDWQAGRLVLASSLPARRLTVPGRPARPELVAPRLLKPRGTHSRDAHAALVHALCHIEFNAINLALDAVYRFRDMPAEYYTDWVRVAAEEAYHFSLLAAHLRTLGHAYGDYPAHNGLWEMALETDHDVMVRMALVPRVMEARGLDVTPGIIAKLEASGDREAVAILRIIQRDEVGHVEIGSRWFRFVCRQRGLNAFATFKQLLSKYLKGRIKGPYDRVNRKRAGFSDEELAYLETAG
jgi:uncharacterized ferritin-like protein (DUF455 family)